MKAYKMIWCIAYISRDYLDIVNAQLKEYGYEDVKAYIPTVRIIKKKFKGKNQYEEIPLLFNYGFFQIPQWKALDIEYLKLLRERISCIYAWVQDPIKVVRKKPKLDLENKDIGWSTQIATATEQEIVDLLKISETSSVFSDLEINKLKPGVTIILQGYPFEDMPAEIIRINKETKEIKVKLLLESIMTQVTVSFENVFYTIYSNFDGTIKERSLEELTDGKTQYIDKLYANISYDEE